MKSNFETNKSPVIMEVSDGFDKPQPPIKLQKVVQNDQTSMKGSEDSKDQTIETQLPKAKKHVSEAHFVEKKKIDQKSKSDQKAMSVHEGKMFQCSICNEEFNSKIIWKVIKPTVITKSLMQALL